MTNTRFGSATVELPTDTQILITRRFDAPASLVFTALTTPEHVRRWWGWSSSEMIVCDIDLRVGGRWRYVVRDEHGSEFGWHGEYTELDAPGRMVSSEVFEGFPDAASLNTTTLTEADGVTTLTTLAQHTCREHRDGHLEDEEGDCRARRGAAARATRQRTARRRQKKSARCRPVHRPRRLPGNRCSRAEG